MIRRTAKFEWLVSFGPYQQKVIGSRRLAEMTFKDLQKQWKDEISSESWLVRMILTLNVKYQEAVRSA